MFVFPALAKLTVTATVMGHTLRAFSSPARPDRSAPLGRRHVSPFWGNFAGPRKFCRSRASFQVRHGSGGGPRWRRRPTAPGPFSVVRLVRDACGMELYAGHTEESRIVHLTSRSFLVEALCGEPVHLDGEPDIAVICEDCDRLGREAGGDPGEWVTEVSVVELRAAA